MKPTLTLPSIFVSVHGSPLEHQASLSAYHFVAAAKRQAYIPCVFFNSSGVQTASNSHQIPQDEFNLNLAWSKLASKESIRLLICVSACIKRGIFNQQESERYQTPGANLLPGFEIAGLGDMVEQMNQCDRTLTFQK